MRIGAIDQYAVAFCLAVGCGASWRKPADDLVFDSARCYRDAVIAGRERTVGVGIGGTAIHGLLDYYAYAIDQNGIALC